MFFPYEELLAKFITPFTFLLPYLLAVQSDSIPAQAYIHSNNINALVNANGLLFYDKEKGGQFLTDSAGHSPIKAAGLWLGGFDPGGNLKLAAQLYNEDGKRDFVPGFSDSLEGDWNHVWKVKRSDMVAQYRDFRDDGVIDDTIASVFDWPASGNKHFKRFNGFDFPTGYFSNNFIDENGNGIYDPENGDIPYAGDGECNGYVPDQILWSVFQSNIDHTESLGSQPLNLTINQTIYSYSCDGNPYISNTVFCRYLISNNEKANLDSFIISLYFDFELGCPNDDYVATIPETLGQTILVYNSDNFDENCGEYNGYGEHPPAIACSILRGPLNEFRNKVPINTIMPLSYDSINPKTAQEFYTVMTGKWLDGTALTFGGNGYDPTSTDYTNFIYPGYLLKTNSWTEATAGNLPGRRRIIASFDDFRLEPDAANEVIVAFTFFPNGQFPLENRLFEIYNNYEDALSILFGCDGGSPNFTCIQTPPFDAEIINSPVSEINLPFIFTPNPANDLVKVAFVEMSFATSFEIYDPLCRLIYESKNSSGSLNIDTSTWPQGMYYAIARKGPEMYFSPLVVARR